MQQKFLTACLHLKKKLTLKITNLFVEETFLASEYSIYRYIEAIEMVEKI